MQSLFTDLMPEPLRAAMTQQGERVLEAQKAATRWQLDQATQVTTAGLKAWRQSADAVLDAQAKWIAAFQPASADA